MKIIPYVILFIISFSGVSAQMTSANYESPANGIVSSGGIIQSQNYDASGTILWFYSPIILSANYTQEGIGNLEILNGKSVTEVEKNEQVPTCNGIFPNPLVEESVLRLSVIRTGIATIEFFDCTGKKIHGESFNIHSSSLVSVPLAGFYHQAGKGVYILKLSLETESKIMIVYKI